MEITEDVEKLKMDELYDLGDYISDDCPNCGRQRLCKTSNNKHRCEKCDWIVEDECYYKELL